MLKRLGPMPIHAPMFADFFASPLQKGFHLHLCLEAIQTHHAGCGTWRWEQRRKGCLPIHRPAGERWGPEMRVALGTVVYCGILWYTVVYCGILWYTVVLGFSKTCLHFASLLWRYRYFMILPLGAITFTVEFEWGPELAWNPWEVNSGKRIPWHSGCFSVLSFYLQSYSICYNDIIGTWTCTQDSK